MSPLVKELLINGLMAGTALKTAKTKSASMGYTALAGGIAALGFVFLSIAAHALLVQYMPMPAAAATVGGAILLIALAVGVFGHYRTRTKKIIKKPIMEGNFIDNVENAIKSMADGFEGPVQDNPKMALLLAALAGFAAGDQLGDRARKH